MLGNFRPLLTTLALVMAPALAWASSHSEAPGTAKDRLADDTDLYAWVAADARDAVTIVGNWVPLLEPNGGPNFHGFDDEVHYYVNVDNVGDAKKHVRFEFTFTTERSNPNTFLYNTGVVTSFDDPDLNVRQYWSLTRWDDGVPTVLATRKPVAPNRVGPRSMPDYQALAQSTITTLGDGTKIFVGPRDDPFFVDLAAIFDLLTIRKPPGNKGKGVDGVAGYDVMSIVMQVPKRRLTKDGAQPSAAAGNHVIGIWDTAERAGTRTIASDGSVTLSGPARQVSRLGMPLVNEVVVPLGKKDLFNRSEPENDVANFGASVVDPELAKLFTLIYGIRVPPAPRLDIVTVFATGIPGLNQPPNVTPGEMLRLNLTIPPSRHPHRLGVLAGDLAGFPNGRRLGDDVVDIEERVVAGVLVEGFNVAPNNRLGDGVDANDLPYLPYFPYVAAPHDPFDHTHHAEARRHHRGDRDDDDDVAAPANESDARAGDEAAPPRLSFAGPHPAPVASLEFTVPTPSHVTLEVFDVQGRAVRTLVDQDAAAGTFRAQWNGKDDAGRSLGKGVFFVRFATGGKVVETKKVVIE